MGTERWPRSKVPGGGRKRANSQAVHVVCPSGRRAGFSPCTARLPEVPASSMSCVQGRRRPDDDAAAAAAFPEGCSSALGEKGSACPAVQGALSVVGVQYPFPAPTPRNSGLGWDGWELRARGTGTGGCPGRRRSHGEGARVPGQSPPQVKPAEPPLRRRAERPCPAGRSGFGAAP